MKQLLTLIGILLYSLCFSQAIKKDSVYQNAVSKIYKDPSESISVFTKLLKKYNGVEDQAELYWQISTAYIAKRDFDSSLKFMNKGQQLLTDIENPRIKMQILVSIAVLYQQMDLFTKSFDMLNEAEKISNDIPDNSESKIHLLGNVYAIRGMIYRSQSSPEMALEKFIQAKENYQKIKNKISAKANLSVILYNMGYTYFEKNDVSEAKQAFEESIAYARLAKANSLEAFALKGLAETYFREENFSEALVVLKKAEILAEPVGDLVLNEGIFKGFSNNYLALDQFEEYQLYNKKYVQTRFERQQNELESINSEIDNQIDYYKQEIEAEEKSSKLALILMITIGCACMMGLGFMIFRTKKENNRILSQIQKMAQT